MWWMIPAALLAASLFLCYISFYKSFYASNKKPADPYTPMRGPQYQEVRAQMHANTKVMEAASFEGVYITSFDGTRLFGRYYHHRDGAPLIIFFHGYRSMALRDGAGGFGLAKKLGLNILAVDQRAHGHSGGHVITFGVKEQKDCLAWAQYAAARFGNTVPIILSGLSMGAATVIMATALPLPETVCCVIADCPYSTPREIIQKVAKDLGFSGALSYPVLWFGARVFGGFDLGAKGAAEAAVTCQIPALILHGEDDRLVPCEMGRKIAAASNGCIKIETFPDAGHGLSFLIDPTRYEKEYAAFLRSVPALASHFVAEDAAVDV